MPYTDFKELKSRFTIDKVAELLGLTLKPSGPALRGPCPACGTGGERALVITPAKGVFFCWAGHEGGDLIQLTAHIRKSDVKTAAAWLARDRDAGSGGASAKGTGPRTNGELQPLELDHDHPAVTALGFSAEDAEALGIGYAGRGLMRGFVAVPVRLPTGELAGYIGLTDIAKLPPRWHGIPGNVVPIRERA